MTDATTGATALLLSAQNTHTLHDPIRDTEHARARVVVENAWFGRLFGRLGGLDGGGGVNLV